MSTSRTAAVKRWIENNREHHTSYRRQYYLDNREKERKRREQLLHERELVLDNIQIDDENSLFNSMTLVDDIIKNQQIK